MKPKDPRTPNEPKEPAIPVKVPVSVARWLLYDICFLVLLLPFRMAPLTHWQWVCGAMILGWFAGLLNAIAYKK